MFSLYALAGPINTFRTVDKVTLNDVVGEQEEDADFDADANSTTDTVDSSEGQQDEESSNKV